MDPTAPSPPRTFSFEDVVSRQSDPAFHLVDVLPAASYANGHIPGALHLPLEELPELAAVRLPDRTAEIGVYCSGPT